MLGTMICLTFLVTRVILAIVATVRRDRIQESEIFLDLDPFFWPVFTIFAFVVEVINGKWLAVLAVLFVVAGTLTGWISAGAFEP